MQPDEVEAYVCVGRGGEFSVLGWLQSLVSKSVIMKMFLIWAEILHVICIVHLKWMGKDLISSQDDIL